MNVLRFYSWIHEAFALINTINKCFVQIALWLRTDSTVHYHLRFSLLPSLLRCKKHTLASKGHLWPQQPWDSSDELLALSPSWPGRGDPFPWAFFKAEECLIPSRRQPIELLKLILPTSDQSSPKYTHSTPYSICPHTKACTVYALYNFYC